MPPEDDRDRALARRLGDRLEAGAPLDAGEEADAAFVRALIAFRQQQEAPPEDAGARVWARLEAQMQGREAAPPRRARILPLRPAWAWMAAASVLVLVGLGWLLWRAGPADAVLLASAGEDLVTHTLADGSTVTLRPRSQLYALGAEAGAVRVRLVGEGFFDVVANAARTFKVEAGAAQVTVLGTRFDVSTWGGQTTVYLEEGRVRFEHLPTKRAVVLAPGQRSALTAGGDLLAPEAAAAEEYTDWLRRAMTFTERPLRRILAELEHHYGVRFDVPAALLDETLSGRILLVDRQRSIEDLAVVMGGRFVQVDEQTYRFGAP